MIDMNSPFTPSPDDGAIEILRMIFGKVMDGLVAGTPAAASNETANMLGEAFRFMNSGVLFFGTIILLYVSIFSVANTANDGKVLGEKWSTFYTPLRTIGSAAALIPTASGYAGIQLILLMVVVWSVGFASSMWKSVVEYSVGQQVVEQAVKSITDDPNFNALALNALRMRVCAAGVSKGVSQTLGTQHNLKINIVNTSSDSFSISRAKTTTYTSTVSFSDPNWPGSDAVCGKILLSNTFFAPKTNSQVTTDVAHSLQNAIGQIRYNAAMGLLAGNSALMTKLADEVIQAAEEDGKQISASDFGKRIDDARAALVAEITTEVRKQISAENSESARKLSEKGWVYAGSLYREMARIKDAVRNATKSRSEYIPGTGTLDTKLTGDVLTSANTILARYNSLAGEVVNRVTMTAGKSSDRPVVPKIQTSFTVNDFAGGGNGIKTMITSYFNQFSYDIVTGIVHYLGDHNEDPLMRIKNVGDWTSGAAESVMASKVIIKASLAAAQKTADQMTLTPGAVSGGIAFVWTLFDELWRMVSASVYTFLYLGYFLSIWIPMIPFYIFALGVIGWLIFVVEMLAAGVLWMVAHSTPARDNSFIGSQTQGYLLIMSGFFRPALMVLGLVASMALMNPAIEYINEAFILAFLTTQADSVSGLLSSAGMLMVYCVVIFAVLLLIFQLPQSLPDRILRWIGAGIGDMGEQSTASRVEQVASTQAKAAMVAMAAKEIKADKSKNVATGKNRSFPEGHSGQSTAITSFDK